MTDVAADIDKQNDTAMSTDEWTVYVLMNAQNITYTGIAKDTGARLIQHNTSKGARFTKGRGPWTIVYTEGPLSHAEALRRERALKKDVKLKRHLKKSISVT